MEIAVRRSHRMVAAWCLSLFAVAGCAGMASAASTAEPAAEAPHATPPLERRVSVNLDRVPPAAAFRTFAGLAEVTAAVDPQVKDLLTIRVENVRVKTLLDVVCESLGCRWEISGSPAVLHVTAIPGQPPKLASAVAGLRDSIQLKVEGADAREVLRVLADSLGAELALDPAVQGKVTLDANGMALQLALDAVCQQAGCGWTLAKDDRGRRSLKVFPRKP